MTLPTYDGSSSVESVELQRSGRPLRYEPTEKVGIIEVDNFPLLGKLTAFRFIEWVLKNPGGVISLPTGKTPEFFIKWVNRILARWEKKEIQSLLEGYGIKANAKPDMKSLSFVQIDEFYPMDAQQHNSFHHYVRNYYIKGFGLSPEKALLIDATSLGLPDGKTMQEIFPNNLVDLSLRVRQTRTEAERIQKDSISCVDVFCMEYERKVRELGGIGFFLGGIGPDGHIAFNVRGSSFYSVTRLTPTNYETQAAAATDLGGIEISRSRLVITIGLATIAYNPSATVLISAAGDAKAPVVRSPIEETMSPLYPASILQTLENSRFYLTKGAASHLAERRYAEFVTMASLSNQVVDDIVINLSLTKNKPLVQLTAEDFAEGRFARELVHRTGAAAEALAASVRQRMIAKLEGGLSQISEARFLHTEPHHDDIMLGYLPYLYHLVRDPSNKHSFANLTSGFTAVSNQYFLSIMLKLQERLDTPAISSVLREGYSEEPNMTKKMEDVYLFLDGTAGNMQELKDDAEARRMMRNLVEIYRTSDMKVLRLRVRELSEYLNTQYPGAKDPPDIQALKGMLREWEVELLWAYFGLEASAIHPLRLGFYQGDIFSEEPEVSRDVMPIFELMEEVKPTIVSVAFDPEGSGPDTHYKVLQAVAEALRMYEKESGNSDITVWGYRNVWYRFTPGESDVMVPVSLNTLSLLHTSFMNCFGSQSAASFPSYEYDGPFSKLAQKIMVEQYVMVKTCLGDDYFLKHAHPRLRAARGLIYMKRMPLVDFYERVRELRKVTEG